jgi:hypothetical protein
LNPENRVKGLDDIFARGVGRVALCELNRLVNLNAWAAIANANEGVG